ncbi:magnesium transporter CorA family protein [Candidatus Woesebacteria bacterium]|nr:magnesium transporter CorA family protein [Candidatus Woesebacteria bacterium]
MITIYYRNLRDRAIQKLEKYRVGSWIQVEVPTEEEIIQLAADYHLDESLLKDATDEYEVPRMEVEDGVNYIFSRYPFRKNDHISTSPILFILKDSHVITVTKEKFPLIEPFFKRNIFFTTQKTKLFLQLFTLINTSYNSYLHTISRETRTSSYDLERITNKDIALFVRYERVLNDFHLALVRTNAVLKILLSHHNIKLFDSDRDLIEDIFLNNDQLIQLSNENLKSIVNIRDASSTIMTHNTNRVIRFFTSVTVILTIPTIVGSLFGMNVTLPFAESEFAFPGIMLFTILVSVGLVVMFLKNDWL